MKNYRRLHYCGIDMKREVKSGSLAFLLRMLGYHKRTGNVLKRYETCISQYPVELSDIVCNHGNRYREKDYIPKEYYGNGVMMLFEGMNVRVPEKYDEYLACLYDDWRTPPPENEQKAIHPCEICDTKRIYKNYVKNRSN